MPRLASICPLDGGEVLLDTAHCAAPAMNRGGSCPESERVTSARASIAGSPPSRVPEQKFLLVPANSGEGPIPGLYEIRPASDPSMCLIPNSNESACNGQPVPNGQGAQVVQQARIFYAQDQNWSLLSTNEIVNQYWGTGLDTTGSGSRDHEHVMIWPCNGTSPSAGSRSPAAAREGAPGGLRLVAGARPGRHRLRRGLAMSSGTKFR